MAIFFLHPIVYNNKTSWSCYSCANAFKLSYTAGNFATSTPNDAEDQILKKKRRTSGHKKDVLFERVNAKRCLYSIQVRWC